MALLAASTRNFAFASKGVLGQPTNRPSFIKHGRTEEIGHLCSYKRQKTDRSELLRVFASESDDFDTTVVLQGSASLHSAITGLNENP